MTFPTSLIPDSHPGFRPDSDRAATRRQFHISLAVAIALALAIGGSAFALRPMNEDLRLQPVQTSDAWPADVAPEAGS